MVSDGFSWANYPFALHLASSPTRPGAPLNSHIRKKEIWKCQGYAVKLEKLVLQEACWVRNRLYRKGHWHRETLRASEWVSQGAVSGQSSVSCVHTWAGSRRPVFIQTKLPGFGFPGADDVTGQNCRTGRDPSLTFRALCT